MIVRELKHFKLSEFDSPDQKGSGDLMEIAAVEMLDMARELAGIPFRITSGYRTKAYHASLKKRGYETARNSPHLVGKAADIAYNNENSLSKIVSACVAAGFTSIGIGNGFVHVDTRKRKAVWFYKDTPLYARVRYKDLVKNI